MTIIFSFDDLISKYKQETITDRQLITYAKNKYKNDIIKKTQFLDIYENVDIIERLYYIVNNITEVVKCKYCNNKASWVGRGLKEGYREICSSKECRSKQLTDVHSGSKKISENRDRDFIEWQNTITYINDDIVKEHIKYDKFIPLITNPIILNYLNNRFSDSSSIKETLKRIEIGIEKKPICAREGCNNPVVWIGRKRGLFSKYCCDSCRAKSEETHKLMKKTQLERYGYESCFNSPEFQKKIIEKYGTPYVSQSPVVREKIRKSYIENHGYENPFLDNEVRTKSFETAKKNSTLQKSKEEDEVYCIIQSVYTDVIHHYRSSDFPFSVDFYIPSLEIYIEYQGSQFHNNRAYLNKPEDIEEAKELQKKSDQKRIESNTDKTNQYDGILYTWADLDVRKRNMAQEKKLNYLEIYSYKDKQDILNQIERYVKCLRHKQLYFINDKNILKEFNDFENMIVDCDVSEINYISYKNQIIRHFQFLEFYRNELDLYAKEPVTRRAIIQNRMKYLNKEEYLLTDSDIISGFKKSGIFYGYSHFNPEYTNWFVHRFNIKRIYDPCGGWGHHMLGMLSCDRIYYNDFSESVCNNVQKIKEYFGISQLYIHFGDGKEYVPDDIEIDGWFMCPPYYNLETYECENFGSIIEYKDFLNKIIDNWKNSPSKIFGIVLREDFGELIDDVPTEVYTLKKPSMHLTENKKYQEKFYILKK